MACASVLAWTCMNDSDFSVIQLQRQGCMLGLEFLGLWVMHQRPAFNLWV